MNRNIIISIIILVITGSVQAADIGEVDIHGFISQGYLKSDENNFMADTEDGTFQFNEMGINFGTKLTNQLRAGMQLFARDMGDLDNDQINLDWAYGDYRFRDWLGFRIGLTKAPYGLYNEVRDYDMLRTSVLLNQAVYLDSTRSPMLTCRGFGLYGDIGIGPAGSLSYLATVGDDDVAPEVGAARVLESSMLEYGMNIDVTRFESDKTYTGSLIWNTSFPYGNLLLGGAYRVSAQDIYFVSEGSSSENLMNVHDVTFVSLSLEYTIDDLTLVSEYSTMETDFTAYDGAGPPLEQPRDVVTEMGWYGSISYRFIDWFEMAVAYGERYMDKNDKKGTNDLSAMLPGIQSRGNRGWQKDWTLSTRFDIVDGWILKIEGHRIDGTALLYGDENMDAEGRLDVERKWYLFAAKMSYSF